MKKHPSESDLETVIEDIVRSYVANIGRKIGHREKPYANQQGTDPTKNGRPFDLLFEIDSRLLMLEVKVQIGQRMFNDLRDDRHQMANLCYLWNKGVKVYYSFNIRTPCPDYRNQSEYPDLSEAISQIAGINPLQMKSFIDGEIESLCESENSLKALFDSNDSGETLPKALHDWPSSLYGPGHTTTYLFICYNIEQGLIEIISKTQFNELANIFKYGKPSSRNIVQEIPNEIIDKICELRDDWKKQVELSNNPKSGGLSL